MSAIAGLWGLQNQPDVRDDCLRMLQAQEMYGPHHAGVWSEGSLAMGRRLYRTLPEDIHDRQPLTSRDGRLTLVADIRVDNRDELAGALGWAHAEAAQLCDAAFLHACLEQWGERALDRLAGPFAFALWDAKAQSLTLARDYCGQRPLHYHRGRDVFAFASMPKGLHALPQIPRAPDEDAVAEFVALIPEKSSCSFFAGIERVMPGQIVTVTRDGMTSRNYWQPRRPGQPHMSERDAIDGLRHHLDQATKAALRGAGQTIAAQLSAGLDSSAVTATAARLLAPGGGKAIAFTAVPRNGYSGSIARLNDEGPLAARTAAMHANIEHVLVHGARCSPVAGLDRAAFLCDRPILNPTNWTWGVAIADAARARKLLVMLTGQTGNMTLSYGGKELLPELLGAGRLVELCRVGAELVAKGNRTWRGVLSGSLGPYLPRRAWFWANQRFSTHKRDIFNYTAIRADRLAAFDMPALVRERGFDFTYRAWRDSFAMREWAIARRDTGNYSKGYLAGWGIDERDPTADRRLAEFCLSVPTEHFLADGIPRALARKALADRLPPEVVNLRTRGFQAADWYEGATAARAEIVDELARLEEHAPAAGIIDVPRLKSLTDNWPSSGWERPSIRQGYRLALLRGIAAGHFMRKAAGANR